MNARLQDRAPSTAFQSGVLVLSGYGLRVAVQRGHLILEDGVGRERWHERFSRVDRDLKRVVIIGHAGTITLDAIRWLHGVGVPLLHLDTDGRVLLAAAPAGVSTEGLRRAQANAADSTIGLEISRDLVVAKLGGQHRVLDDVPGGVTAQVPLLEHVERARRAATLSELRDAEARGARAYWQAWRVVRVRLDPAYAERRPRHWQRFGSRISPLTDPSPRKAVNPANAALNYLYAILEAEARIAALATGLDPTLGLLHADRPHRDSLACDLMEPVRPAVDRFVLRLLNDRVFTKGDVFERLDGHCRLLPPLTVELAATAAMWAKRVRPIAEHVAERLLGAPSRGSRAAGAVTGGRRWRRPRGKTAVIRGFDHTVAREADVLGQRAPAMAIQLRKVLAANREWDRQNERPDPQSYRETILPKLVQVPLKRLCAATGLSMVRCSQIRCGDVVPHPRHWETLGKIAPTGD